MPTLISLTTTSSHKLWKDVTYRYVQKTDTAYECILALEFENTFFQVCVFILSSFIPISDDLHYFLLSPKCIAVLELSLVQILLKPVQFLLAFDFEVFGTMCKKLVEFTSFINSFHGRLIRCLPSTTTSFVVIDVYHIQSYACYALCNS